MQQKILAIVSVQTEPASPIEATEILTVVSIETDSVTPQFVEPESVIRVWSHCYPTTSSLLQEKSDHSRTNAGPRVQDNTRY